MPTDLSPWSGGGSGCLVGTSNCPCREGRAHYRKCIRVEFREQRVELQAVGMRVDSSRKHSERELCREKVKHGVERPWVQTSASVWGLTKPCLPGVIKHQLGPTGSVSGGARSHL